MEQGQRQEHKLQRGLVTGAKREAKNDRENCKDKDEEGDDWDRSAMPTGVGCGQVERGFVVARQEKTQTRRPEETLLRNEMIVFLRLLMCASTGFLRYHCRQTAERDGAQDEPCGKFRGQLKQQMIRLAEYLTDLRAAHGTGRFANAEHFSNFQSTLQITTATLPKNEAMRTKCVRTSSLTKFVVIYLLDICMGVRSSVYRRKLNDERETRTLSRRSSSTRCRDKHTAAAAPTQCYCNWM